MKPYLGSDEVKENEIRVSMSGPSSSPLSKRIYIWYTGLLVTTALQQSSGSEVTSTPPSPHIGATKLSTK